MTLTLRQTSVAGAVTASRALTYAEMDANFSGLANGSNWASAVSTSGTVSIGRGNGAGIYLPSQGSSPFQIAVSAPVFNGTVDSTFKISYNPDRANTSDSSLSLIMEGDYNDGVSRYNEINLDFGSSDGLVSKRYMAFQVKKTDGSSSWAHASDTARIESVMNNGEFIFTTATGRLTRSVNDGAASTAAGAAAALFLQNTNSSGTGVVSPALQFDVGSGGGNAKIFSSRLGGSGGVLHFATDSTSGTMTDRVTINETGQMLVSDGSTSAPGVALASVSGSGFYKGGFGSISYSNNGVEAIAFAGGFGLGSASVVQWSATSPGSGNADVVLQRSGTSALQMTGVLGIGVAGSTTTNLILAAGTTGVSSLRIPHGSAPTSPVNGDMWTTTSGLFIRINGSTVGPLS